MQNTNIRVFHNNILFQFEDELVTASGIKQFKQKTDWGFDLGANVKTNMNDGRWCIVSAIGPDVVDVKVGMRVFVEPLKWTKGIEHDGYNYWMTTENHVFLIDESDV